MRIGETILIHRMPSDETLPDSPIRIGISACLLGESVRYDGGHKQDRYLTDTLGKYFEWVPVCPEVELGLGTPRDTMRLESKKDGLHLVVPRTARDLTNAMQTYGKTRVKELAGENLCGYILKSHSPSCGMEGVRVYGSRRTPAFTGRGLFAEALFRQFPGLPIEEESRLHDPRLRENWIERVFVYRSLQAFWNKQWIRKDLLEFHAAHKFTLLAHSPAAFEKIGRVVANPGTVTRRKMQERYHAGLLAALSVPATRSRHATVLRQMARHFKSRLDADSQKELSELIGGFRRGEWPLIVPVTLIRHYVRRLKVACLASQTYLNPQPGEIALRNHA